jgi:hypothetical protein
MERGLNAFERAMSGGVVEGDPQVRLRWSCCKQSTAISGNRCRCEFAARRRPYRMKTRSSPQLRSATCLPTALRLSWTKRLREAVSS